MQLNLQATSSLNSRVRSTEVNLENKKDGKVRLCHKHIKNYLNNSTLHGLRYVGDPCISFGERACWLLCFITAILAGGCFVSLIYVTYDRNPVIITSNPLPVPISDIPFPTITVCSMNKVKKSVANWILKNGTEVQRSILSSYCEDNLNVSMTQYAHEQASNWENVLKFILKAGQPCKEMIKVCLWKSVEINCEKWFNPTLTDDGLCCTFNQMPSSYIFRHKKNFNVLSYNYPLMVEDWNQETGYRKNAPNDAFPWRTEDAGVHFGLTIALDAQVHEYFCSPISTGFKVLMHNPLETPTMADFGRLVPISREVWNEIEATVQETTDALRSISFTKRHCYFNEEKYLRFFRLYTEANCIMECRANYTVKMCDCVPYFLPRDVTKRICEFKDTNCTTEADGLMQVSELDEEAICKCLPSCFALSFDKNSHFGTLHNTTIKSNLLKNMSADYFIKNGVIIHTYFSTPLLTKFIKRELYGFTEFLSNTGGLLGLFLGFSVLSAVELLYYLSLKILCSYVRSRDDIFEIQRYQDDVAVYPFVH